MPSAEYPRAGIGFCSSTDHSNCLSPGCTKRTFHAKASARIFSAGRLLYDHSIPQGSDKNANADALNEQQISFLTLTVVYLGHVIGEHGLRPTQIHSVLHHSISMELASCVHPG